MNKVARLIAGGVIGGVGAYLITQKRGIVYDGEYLGVHLPFSTHIYVRIPKSKHVKKLWHQVMPGYKLAAGYEEMWRDAQQLWRREQAWTEFWRSRYFGALSRFNEKYGDGEVKAVIDYLQQHGEIAPTPGVEVTAEEMYPGVKPDEA